MKSDVYWIAGPWPGRLAILARPRGGDWLEDEVAGWKAAGIGMVVSALTPEEEIELDIEPEEALATVAGINFVHLPIPDREVPEAMAVVTELVTALLGKLAAGENVGIHCRQGIGRSGLLSACVLIAGGVKVDAVWQHIEKGRGRPAPDTVEQREWVEKWARCMTEPRTK